MGFFIHPYAIRVDAVRSAVGSASAPLGERLAKIEMSPAEHELAHALLRGEPAAGDKALAALERLVQALGGEFLTNDQWAPFRSAWLSDVDDALAQAGVEGRVSSLVYGPSPVLIPGTAENHAAAVDGAKVEATLARFAGWERARQPERRGAGQVVSWLEHARAHGKGLITFFIW